MKIIKTKVAKYFLRKVKLKKLVKGEFYFFQRFKRREKYFEQRGKVELYFPLSAKTLNLYFRTS